MSNQQGLQTPRRPTYNNIFDDEDAEPTPVDNATTTQNPCFTFTPCTRLSRMTLNSQSNGSRMRTVQYQMPASNFNDKLMQAIREEKEEQAAKSSSPHPNLDMFLNADKISMMDTKSSKDFSFSEDEESDEGEFFSSSLCPMSSPERPITQRSIFDDESMALSPPPPSNGFKRSIFDEDDDEEDGEQDNQDHINNEYGDFYDPSSSWLSCIYEDNGTNAKNTFQGKDQHDEADQEGDDDEDENRPPRYWHSRQQHEKKIRRTSPQEEENAVHDRIPLRQINIEDYYSDNEDLPVKKKIVLANKKPHKLRFMRALSPPKYMFKHKGKETLSSSSTSSSSSSSASSSSSSTSYL
ncbi:Mitochondrial presequence protease [Mucor velutinosus]|uniref:Mitochondrial presequence protease n=1 Tax=Mucor velutinosus TaxID=708070 RepID=A0AAN7DQJ1_9FUNG|nr:Mitochondrial presequence protease [Mucor velutinosus]